VKTKEVAMNLVERAKGILLNPKGEWEKIKGESTTATELIMQYAIILAAIPAVASFIGLSLIGTSMMGFTFRWPIGSGLFRAIMTYALSVGGAYLMGFIIDALAPNFGAQKDLNASMKVAVYSMTATWVAGIFFIIPALAMIAILAGFYSLFLLFLGMQTVKAAPQDKQMGYFIVSLVVAIVINMIIYFLTNSIFSRGIVPGITGNSPF
jgi:hypothetical protein